MNTLPPVDRLKFNGQTFYSQEHLEKLETARCRASGLYHDALAGLRRMRRRLDREIRRRMAAERRASEAEAAIAEFRETVDRQDQAIEAMEIDLRQARAANARIARDRDAARTDASHAHARIRTLEAELDVADNRARNASSRADVAQRRAEDAESNVASMRALLRDAEARARQAEADASRLEARAARGQEHAAPTEIRLDCTVLPPFNLGEVTFVPLPPAQFPSPPPAKPERREWLDGDGYSIAASPARSADVTGATIAAYVRTTGPEGVLLTEGQAREVAAHLIACAEYHANGGRRG